MGLYADGIRDAQTSLDDVADLIDGLLIGVSQVSDLSVRSTASVASFTDITGTSVSPTIESGEIPIIIATVNSSNSSLSAQGQIQIVRSPSTVIGEIGIWNPHTTNTNGLVDFHTLVGVDTTVGAGSNTYKLQFTLGAGSSGTFYVAQTRVMVLQLQNAA